MSVDVLSSPEVKLFPAYNPVNAVEKARSPDPDFCFGYENTDTKGCYITAVKLSTGKVSIAGLGKDEVLEGIIAYDRAERNTWVRST